LVASLTPYFSIVLAVAWAAPVTARELETGTSTWAWSMGVTRRSWLLARTAPMFAVAVLGALLIGAMEALTERHWLPAMTQDALQSQHIAAAWPAEVGFAVFAAALGVVAAIVSRKVVTAVGVSLVVQVAVAWVAPGLAVRLAPTRVSDGSGPLTGHLISQDTVAGALRLTYVPNSAYWPVVLCLAAVLVLLAVALGAIALLRIGRIDA
jgi:hypothetical protein